MDARTKELGQPIKTDKCSISSLRKDQMSVALPEALRAANETNACLTFEFAKISNKKKLEQEGNNTCPELVRYSYDKSGKVQKSNLLVSDKKSIINDPEFAVGLKIFRLLTRILKF